MDEKFQNNILLTQTERLTMNGRPTNPKYARNKNVLVIGGSGSGKTTLLHALNNLVSEDENVQISGDIRLEEDSIYDMLPEVLRKK